MLANKLLGQIINVNEKQNRKVDVTNRLLGLLAKVKPGNLNSASSVPADKSTGKPSFEAKQDNDAFIKLIEYTKLTSERTEQSNTLAEKMLKVIETKFNLFNSSLVDIKDAIEEEDKDKPNIDSFKAPPSMLEKLEDDIKEDFKRVKENILDFVVPGRERLKRLQEEKKPKEKENKEPKRPKVIPLVATPIQAGVANVESSKSNLDLRPIIKTMDRNTLRLVEKLDELIQAQPSQGILGGMGDLAAGAVAGGLLSRGAGALKKGAGMVGRAALAAAPTLAAGAVAVAGGAAVDYGLGKLGVGKDEQGNDVQVNEQQDEANWQKMTTGQKIQSGLARGIEKIGDTLFLGNMARQARVERIKKETEYLQTNTKEVVKSNEASTSSQKADNIAPKDKVDIQFSEATFAQKDPENYKKFVEFRNKRTEEIYKQRIEKYDNNISQQSQEINKQVSQNMANRDAVLKFKGEIEAAGAGSVKVENKNQSVTTSNVTNTPSSTSNATNATNSSSNATNATNATNSSSNATNATNSSSNATNATNATNSSSNVTNTPSSTSNVTNNLSQPPNVSSKEVIKGTLIAGEPVVPDKPLSEKQLAVMKMSMEMGNTYSSDILKKYTEQTGIVNKSSSVVNVSPSKVDSVPAPVQPGMLKNLTDVNQEASKSTPPIIVNNVTNQNAASDVGNNSAKSIPLVPGVRNTNSTLERVMAKNAFFTLG